MRQREPTTAKETAEGVRHQPGGESVSNLGVAVSEKRKDASSVTYVAHDDSYLIRRGAPSYHVLSTATTTATMTNKGWSVGEVHYEVEGGGPATTLSEPQAKALHDRFPKFKLR
jgi:hypothetical protein